MPAIRIPGPEDIASVGVARDPGIRATPAAFGSDIAQAQASVAAAHMQEAEALQKVGQAAIHVGAFLDRKRIAATMATATPIVSGQFQQDMEEFTRQQAAKGVPASAWDHGNAVLEGSTSILEQRHAQAVQDFNLDDLSAAKLKGHMYSIQNGYINQGVHWANTVLVNDATEKVGKGVTATSQQTAQSGAPVEDGIAAVNPLVDSLKGIVSPDKIEPLRTAAHKQVIDTTLGTLEAQSKDTNLSPEVRKAAGEQAQALIDRGYGRIPQPGLVQRPLPAATHAVVDKVMQEFPGFPPEVIKAIAGIESGGNPNVQKGKYKGVMQLSDGTVDPRDDEFHKYGGVGSVWDPEQNIRAGVKKIIAENQIFRAQVGRDLTPFDVYMLHQQGIAGYPAHLRHPEAPAWTNMFSTAEGQQKGARWAKMAIWDNIADRDKHLFPGGVESVSGQQFLDYWRMKVEGGAGPTGPGVAGPLVPDMGKALDWHQRISNSQTQLQAKESTDRFDNFNRQLIDAKIGGPLPDRAGMMDDPFMSTAQKNQLAVHHDAVAGDILAFQQNQQKFNDPNGGVFNRFDKNDQDFIERQYQALVRSGTGPLDALQQVVERSQMVPKQFASALRNGLASDKPAAVTQAMNIAGNIMSNHPMAFVGDPGAAEMGDAVAAYKFNSQYYTPEEAAKMHIRANTPEVRADIKARVAKEDVDAIVKKQVEITDLSKAYNEGIPILSRPTVDWTPEGRKVAIEDYARLFKDRYLETGDVNTAKAQAIERLRAVWKPTNVNGQLLSNHIVRYAPEGAPIYQSLLKLNVTPAQLSEGIAAQAISVIKGEPGVSKGLPNGADVTRGRIMLTPLENGQTRAAYLTGQYRDADTGLVKPGVPYQLSWTDSNGKHQYAPQPFVADPIRISTDVSGRAAAIVAAQDARKTIRPPSAMTPEEKATRAEAPVQMIGEVVSRATSVRSRLGAVAETLKPPEGYTPPDIGAEAAALRARVATGARHAIGPPREVGATEQALLERRRRARLGPPAAGGAESVNISGSLEE